MGLRVIIVGGGIAGLATACALKDKHQVTIVEQTRLKTETGAAIHLGPNASRLVIGWGCNLDESPHLNRLREETSQAELQSERMINAPLEFGAPWLLNHRVTLHHELLRVATTPSSSSGNTPKLVTGSRVLSVDEEAGIVHLASGQSLQGDVIIGADGIKSQVRASLFGDSFQAKPSGHSAYRGLVGVNVARRDWNPAHHGSYLQIPAEKIRADPELAYLMSPTGLSIFLGVDRKLVVYTCHYQGQDFLNLVAAVPDHIMFESSEESWYAPGKVEDLQAAFRDFAPKLVRMLSYVEECGLWQLRDQDPLERWVKGRAIIIGDAAHPMTPHLGQGGSQAIEDADMLAYCLANLDSSSDASTINAALERTFSLRYERATMCQERSREQAFGKRAVQLETKTAIPYLDPMQFAGYTFSYQGAKWWAERQEASRSNNGSSSNSQEDGPSKPIALDIPEVSSLSAAASAA